MQFRIFISSVQREFAKERKALAEYIRRDAILGRFFEVFVSEEVPAQDRPASGIYLPEVDRCDIYIGLHGAEYGNVDVKGVSATEREYECAEKKHKTRVCLLKRVEVADARQKKFISRINADVVRKGFATYDELRTAVYAALAKYLESKNLINALPFDASSTAHLQLKDLSIAKIRDFLKKAREIRKWNVPANAKPMEVLDALDLIGENGEILNPAGLPKPRWHVEDGDDFRIVIRRPGAKLPDKLPDNSLNGIVNTAINEPLNEPLNIVGATELMAKIYALICKNPGIRQKDIQSKVERSIATVKRQLELLSDYVEHRGSKKTGGYYVREEVRGRRAECRGRSASS